MGKDKDRQSSYGQAPQVVSPASSNNPSSFRFPRMGFTDVYAATLQAAIDARKTYKIIEEETDLTPNSLKDLDHVGYKLKQLKQRILKAEMKFSDSDNQSIKYSQVRFNFGQSLSEKTDPLTENDDSDDEFRKGSQTLPQTPPFIKIVLRKCAEIEIFHQQSKNVLRGSHEAQKIDEDNKLYDYLTIGKGRIRRTSTSDTQTTDKLFKTRSTITTAVHLENSKSLVSNYLMWMAMNDSDEHTEMFDSGYPHDEINPAEDIYRKNEFKIALMRTLRILSGNVYEKEQRRFRCFSVADSKAQDAKYDYRLNLLFNFHPLTHERYRKSLADLAFCPGNGDILAAAYGIFSFGYMHVPNEGYCCVWNIKNPEDPERIYTFTTAAVSISFSVTTPKLLAIGLYDGTVHIYDISTMNKNPVAVSVHDEISSWDPIISIEWISTSNDDTSENVENESLLALSLDGCVIKYRIISSPYLLAFKQIQLDRVAGAPEGLRQMCNAYSTQSNRYPNGLHITRHPNQHDLYYILTDEGCIHKCSTNNPHQHLSVLQAHIGPVNDMDFSPWSPKLFLTCGNDWYIRIWLDGILEPLVTLKHQGHAIHAAAWSKTHSTVIIANTRSSIDIWDLKHGTIKPVTSARVDKAVLTTFKFSRCGRSIAVGNEMGNVLMLAIDDMPFPPHCQYDQLELALHKCLATKPELLNELKSFGFIGYPEQVISWRNKQNSSC